MTKITLGLLSITLLANDPSVFADLPWTTVVDCASAQLDNQVSSQFGASIKGQVVVTGATELAAIHGITSEGFSPDGAGHEQWSAQSFSNSNDPGDNAPKTIAPWTNFPLITPTAGTAKFENDTLQIVVNGAAIPLVSGCKLVTDSLPVPQASN